MKTNASHALPPDAAGTIYEGSVMHARLKPFVHRFAYRVFTLLIDLDRLPELGRLSPLFSCNKFNILSFHERDHIDARVAPLTSGLRAYVDSMFMQASLPRPSRIMLLAYPRVFGHAFNPISVYYAYDASSALTAMIYEVRNTFGERHSYLCRVEKGDLTASGLRQSRVKKLHVSPFIGMEGRYDFRLTPPGPDLHLQILEHDSDGPLLAAAFAGKAKKLKTPALLSLLFRIPLLGLKVVGLIHFEALRLWLKGAVFHSSPPPPPPASWKDDQTAIRAGE